MAFIEDYTDLHDLIEIILEDVCYIHCFSSAGEFLLKGPSLLPDLILTDIGLPDIDGTQLLQFIRSAPKLAPCPVIAVTAYAMKGDRERFLELGFDDYLPKPIDERRLVQVIRRHLSTSERSRFEPSLASRLRQPAEVHT